MLADLQKLVLNSTERTASLQAVADSLKERGNYRWVGLYDVDRQAGMIVNVVWSGPSAPEYPTFPITKGLTGTAIAERKTTNVGQVAADPRYLTAFGTTQSEIIVPVFDQDGSVVGTIDVESERANAFGADEQAMLEACARVVQPLWQR